MRLVTTVACCAILAACTEATKPNPIVSDPLLAALAEPGRVYVLGEVENQRTEPIVTFDKVCQGKRYVHTIRDTIEFLAGGAARRAVVFEHGTYGETQNHSHMTARGTWEASNGTITLSLAPENYRGTGYAWVIKPRESSDAVFARSGLGGSCAGSATDGRAADFIYTRR
jgi:hypothetical protein